MTDALHGIHRLHRIVSPRFRRARMHRFAEAFGARTGDRVLDVGGSPGNWAYIDAQPQVTLLNTRPIDGAVPPQMTEVIGDGCALTYPDRAFPIVYSNSVIEHVGSWAQQQAFAAEVRRVGQAYYVQTPNKWFPIEPHFMAPVVHWLPVSWRLRLVRWLTPWGWLQRPSPAEVAETVNEIHLLTAADLRALFPDGVIERERVLGLTKSLVVMRPPVHD